MGKESSTKASFEILAYITLDPNRVISGNALALLAKDIEEQKIITQDIAKSMKADITQLKCGDYMVYR
ncbi:capping complex subunit for YIEGIA [Paenibacillus hexagrammi]|uniref:Uncharacterized protein n=1 Tax=Paenibacillus hexagrammi TaxID=2908839 RepID=A0ABY3SKJ8_9BACL|nr:hypothetical protein [Paenibacillus sp. YPD9-1]UJF33616.1 hypothetical protein L0M14_29740 [Paenibacillus sp. YPD9-1]